MAKCGELQRRFALNQQIGIVGLGLLGRGIAGCLLARGYRETGFDIAARAREETRSSIIQAIDDLVVRAGMSPTLIEEWKTRYVEAKSLSEFAECDFVIESVVEDLNVKRTVFDQLESVIRDD